MSFFSSLCVTGMTMTGLKPHRAADQRQPDAGVAGGALDDGAAGPELPRAIASRTIHDRGTILDRLAGIEELGLSEISQPVSPRGPLEADQARASDGLGNTGACCHAFLLTILGGVGGGTLTMCRGHRKWWQSTRTPSKRAF